MPIYIPTSSAQGSLPHIFTNIYLIFWTVAILTGVRWELFAVFVCISLISWASFHVPVGHLCLFWKNIYSGSLLFFNHFFGGCYWVAWLPYIWGLLSSCQAHGLQASSRTLQAAFSRCCSQQHLLSLVSCTFGVTAKKKITAKVNVKELLPLVSFQQFHTFSSFKSSPFWVSVSGVKIGDQFYSSACEYPVSPAPLTEKLSTTPTEYFGSPVNYLLTTHLWIYFQVLNSVPLVYVSVFMPLPYCFEYYSFVNQEMWCLQLCSSFSGLLWLFDGLSEFHTNFRIIFSISVKKMLLEFW